MPIEMRRKDLGPVPNEGARLAWVAIAAKGWDQSTLRAEIQRQAAMTISSGALVKYLYCDRRPGVLWTQAFQAVLGVDPAAWYRAPSEPFETPAAQADSSDSGELPATDDAPAEKAGGDPEAA